MTSNDLSETEKFFSGDSHKIVRLDKDYNSYTIEPIKVDLSFIELKIE